MMNYKSDMATEEQKLRIEKLKVDIDKVKDNDSINLLKSL